MPIKRSLSSEPEDAPGSKGATKRAKKDTPSAPFTAQHKASSSDAIVRAIIDAVISSRQTIYKSPELADVSGNGGSRINDQAKKILKEFHKANGGDGKYVDESIKAHGKQK